MSTATPAAAAAKHPRILQPAQTYARSRTPTALYCPPCNACDTTALQATSVYMYAQLGLAPGVATTMEELLGDIADPVGDDAQRSTFLM